MVPVKKPKNKKVHSVVNKSNISKTDDEAEGGPPIAISGQLTKKLKKEHFKNLKKQRGVVFLKHLPHGFFEEQMKRYFEQFGLVTRLRLARSKKTGGSKGYAFVEFDVPEVAEVAAETMNNYLMFQRVVKAHYIPPSEQRFNYFKSSVRKVTNKAGKQIYVSGKTAATTRQVKELNDWSDTNYQKRVQAKLKKIDKLNSKFAHLGIDFKSILVGPKPVEKNDEIEAATEKGVGDVKLEKRASKRKAKAEQIDDEQTAVSHSSTKKKLNQSIQLKELLGDTLNEDSNDEDWVYEGSVCESASAASSDEESYEINFKDSDSNIEEDKLSNDDDSLVENSGKKPRNQKKGGKVSVDEKKDKVNAKLGILNSDDRNQQSLKRKAHEGAIQKKIKTKRAGSKKANPPNTAKLAKQIELAKNMAKPLATVLKQKNENGKGKGKASSIKKK